MDITKINAIVEVNVLRCAREDFRLCYGLLQHITRAVLVRDGKRALVIGEGTMGVGMVWLKDEEAKNIYGYEEALRVVPEVPNEAPSPDCENPFGL